MIGILGGTFDPVHFGHLRPALEVREVLGLEELRLIPCHVPPHRPRPVASSEQRVAMLEAAIQGYPDFRIDGRELERQGPSYTFDTLTSLRDEVGTAGICLLTGMDAFLGLTGWHRWRELIGLCHIIIMTRPGAQYPDRGELAEFIRRYRVSDPAVLSGQASGCVLFQAVTQLEISATAVRELFMEDRSAGFLMPEAVIDFIQHEGLYKGNAAQ